MYESIGSPPFAGSVRGIKPAGQKPEAAGPPAGPRRGLPAILPQDTGGKYCSPVRSFYLPNETPQNLGQISDDSDRPRIFGL